MGNTTIQEITTAPIVAMTTPRIASVVPCSGHVLVVTFTNGVRKQYDVNHLREREPFLALKNEAFFRNVTVEPGGYAVSWNAELDLSEYELWQHGKELP